ncbi:MAG: hypothetical protein COX77_04130 [Candidatus Komeilibacteria bacterium CG_4_10_14_0_2_um_filter_37_10]|uniref:Uncharacterized protein n=1 Tax=Candidatus Komeilibacteria bacterium CG_4_10_14_0_2_um_filter_37_10 TaxID=1974470 RepID=A0A2M7VDS6_9BACT|nr:MAG: hypothetical protein COX77_04130 [Candidatus Komeilibacteria bacterium CG_4_10_14_0_2_um_filter_37_10]
MIMPELPEVETIKNDLIQKIVGRKITDITALWPEIVKDMPFESFKKAVIGQRIINVKRRAKNLIVELTDDTALLIHLKMTGHVLVTDASNEVNEVGKWIKTDNQLLSDDPQNQFIRIIFYFDDKTMMAMSDLRKFAYIKLVSTEDLNKFLAEYGPEPFDPEFTVAVFQTMLQSKGLAIKKVLMDQHILSGVGNIYADEILWASRVHPQTSAKKLSSEEINAIYDNMKKILQNAIEKRGTSTSDFRDTTGKKGTFGDSRNAYRMTGLPCARCSTPIKRISLGGRGTHFCPVCQKEKP